MTVTSLDSIVKSILMKRGYPMQYYIDFMVYAASGLRELSMDENIQTLRRMVMPVDQTTFTAPLPDDYLDYVKVFARSNQYMRPLVEDNSLSLVPNYDSSFAVQPYDEGIASDSSTNQEGLYNANLSGYWWMVNWDVYGENTGRQFGGVSTYTDTFKINKAANEIKLNENLVITEVVIEYIGNGMDADSATHIDQYAQATIEAYAIWQYYLHSRSYSAGESELMYQKYIQERLILRARLSDLSLEVLKRMIQKNSIRVKY